MRKCEKNTSSQSIQLKITSYLIGNKKIKKRIKLTEKNKCLYNKTIQQMIKPSNKPKQLSQLITQAQQMAPTPVTSLSIFCPPQSSLEQKPFARTQPINTKSTNKHKKSASTTKYNVNKKEEQEPGKVIQLENEDVVKIIEESDNLIKNNELIEGINLLKALKDPAIKFPNPQLKIVILMNLAVAYYQTGFLEQAFEEFNQLSTSLSAQILQIANLSKNPLTRLFYPTLQGKVELQICILFSEMGKHQDALKHANQSCKVHFELAYDVLNALCRELLGKIRQEGIEKIQTDSKMKNLINNIILLEHLHKLIGDLNQIFHVPQKIKLSKQLLADIKSALSLYKNLKIDMQLLFAQNESSSKTLDWIFTNKILDQIQLKPLNPDFFTKDFVFTNAQIVERITYLAISFYCYSTEIRFIEKNRPEKDDTEVMDSEHWLSRSLEIAYSFMPPHAPILNQILTVHDRFHGIDKQTIPQDREIGGFFKVLKPLSKPKSTYSSKSHICSPIMIRIQAPKITIDIQDDGEKYQQTFGKVHQHEDHGKMFDLQALTRNNKIKGLNTRIKILQFSDIKPHETHRTARQPHQFTDTTKITSRSTISDLGSLETQKQKKIRISKIYHMNRKTIEGKYHDFREEPKSKCELEGKAIISQDLLHRPFSYEKNINKWQKIQATTKAYSTQNAKRRKSLPSRNKQKLEKIVYNGSVKLDGLKLTGKKLNQNFDIDQSFLQKLSEAHHNEESLTLNNSNNKPTPTNIFINNNINLYISKGQEFPKTSRDMGEGKQEIGKRQKFINQRRLSHLNIYPVEHLQL